MDIAFRDPGRDVNRGSCETTGVGPRSAAQHRAENPDEIDSDSRHNPHNDEATDYQNGEEYFGYVMNLAETVDPADETENASRLITTVKVVTNTTDHGELSGEDVEDFRYATGLNDLLGDGELHAQRE